MKSSSLQGKTVRPGLMAYSFYRSDRHPVGRRSATVKPKQKIHYKNWMIAVLVIAGGIFAFNMASQAFNSSGSSGSSSPEPQAASPAVVPVAKEEEPKECAGNSLTKLVIVSVGKRHMWACQADKVVYDAPVITGMEAHPETLTPRGTYHVSSKQTDTKLTGADSAGSWDVNVRYWMPFLHNQHGIYGFHDATWRPNSEFGRVSPNSKDASHGCVELPLNASHWLYNWAPTGTTVTVKN